MNDTEWNNYVKWSMCSWYLGCGYPPLYENFVIDREAGRVYPKNIGLKKSSVVNEPVITANDSDSDESAGSDLGFSLFD